MKFPSFAVIPLVCGCMAAVLLVAPESGNAQTDTTQPAPDLAAIEKSLEAKPGVTSPEISRLALNLGNDSWAARETAQKKLETLGPPALPALKRIYNKSKDLEVRTRIEQIFQSEVLPLLFPGSTHIGLLGISLMVNMNMDAEGGIPIASVVQNGAAEKAGIRGGDIIVGLNGRALDYTEGPNGFRYRIMASGKGATVKVQIKRNGETLELPVTLEARDEFVLPDDDRAGLKTWLINHYQPWFDAHVKSPPSVAPEN